LRKFLSSSSVPMSEVSRKLHLYVDEALPLHRNNEEQLSLLILNFMEVWIKLVQMACNQSVMFAEYPPVFVAESLDVLHLVTYHNMVQLQTIQVYCYNRGPFASILNERLVQ
jgi:hypothetical protein